MEGVAGILGASLGLAGWGRDLGGLEEGREPLLYLYLLARGTADTPAMLSPNTSGTFQNGTSLKQFQTGDRKRSCNVRHFLLLLLVEQHQAPVRPI